MFSFTQITFKNILLAKQYCKRKHKVILQNYIFIAT